MVFVDQASGGSLVLRVHVQPKASKSRVLGIHDARLKIAVASPPVDGKANKEVVRFVAKLLGIGKKDVELKSGLQSRKKSLIVTSVSFEEVKQRLSPHL